MIFNEPKLSVIENKSYFNSNFTSNAIYFFNNESINLDIELSELLPIFNESLLMEDTILLSEANKDYLVSVIKYLVSSKKYIEELWNKFSLEHSISQRETASFVGKALTSIEANGFVYEGFRYTIPDENIHIDRALTASESEIRRSLIPENIEREKEKSSDDNMDRIRGQLVGLSKVDAEDFHAELKKRYRNGRTRPVSISVDPRMKDEMLDIIFDTDSCMRSCIHLKKDIIRYIDSLIDYFKKINALISSNVNEHLKSTDNPQLERAMMKEEDLLEFASIQVSYHKKLLVIYTLMLTSKLDAINERHRTYIKVLKHMMKEQERGEE